MLNCLDLSNRSLFSFEIINYLENDSSINELILYNNWVQTEGAIYIADFIKRNANLHKIDVRFCDIHPSGINNIIDSLMDNNSVSSLYLGHNEIDISCIQKISCLLKNINSSLTSLDLSFSEIDDYKLYILSMSIRFNTRLKKLYLASNKITLFGLRYLVDIIKNNNTISKIDLRDNPIVEQHVNELETLLHGIYKISKFYVYGPRSKTKMAGIKIVKVSN